MKKVVLLAVIYCLFSNTVGAQIYFSLGTDITVLRNFNEHQQFWAVGQTVQTNIHFNKKESAYAWISYYTNGHFQNNGTAIAISLLTRPEQLKYTVASTLRYRQLSLGWKHFFKGSFDSENTWNIYGYAGFGLLFANTTNTYNQSIDTLKYEVADYVLPGNGKLNRLTFDAGLGTEYPLGTSIYLYTEIRGWLPASDYPSPYLMNNNIPRMIALNGGVRILID